MIRRCNTATWKTSRALRYAALLLACSPAAPDARDATSTPPTSAAEPEAAPDEVGSGAPETGSGASGTSEMAGTALGAADPGAPELAVTEPAPAPQVAGAGGPEEGSGSSGAQMVDFFEIGRGDRVADLGGVSGYSLGPVRRAAGPAGVVYVRRTTPPPETRVQGERAASSDDLARIVWMNTPDEAPFIAEATRLNAVTLLYGYHAVVAAGHDRKKLNAAVYRALVPGGVYIIAERAAPLGSGLSAARRLNAIEDGVVRIEVQAAGFELVETADFVSSVAREDGTPSQYVLKFRKPK